MEKASISRMSVFVSIIAVFTFPACRDNAEISRQRAALELAEVTKDLDAMFLATKALSSLGDAKVTSNLESIKASIELREKMKVAAADHDHEKAVVLAGDLLQRVPGHPDATRILRESGQIFFYLQAASKAAGGFLEPSSQTDRMDNPETSSRIRAPEGLSKTELDRFWLQNVQNLLRRLNYSVGSTDGFAGAKKTREAVRQFKQTHHLPLSGDIDEDLVRQLEDAVVAKDQDARKETSRHEQLEKRYYALGKAREYVSKARQLDPQFKNSAEFEKLLADAHAAAVYIQASDLLDHGTQLLAQSAKLYDSVISALNTAAESPYLSVQTMWKKISPLVADFKAEDVDPAMSQIKHLDTLLNTYQSGDALKFVNAAHEFTITVQQCIDAFLEPTGTLLQYRAAGDKAISEFKDAWTRAQASIPTNDSVKDSFDGLIAIIEHHSIYSDNRVEQVIAQNEKMFSL